MATFRLDAGILTEEWTSTNGFGGIPGWACRGLCLGTFQAVETLTRYQLTRYRFEEIPYRRALDVVSLDGTQVFIDAIDVKDGPICARNTAAIHAVYNCVKLGPVQFSNYAPRQDSGVYSGLTIRQYSVAFQPLW
jgi:hypothetical protein